MGARQLYNRDGHMFILLEGFGHGEMVPTNQAVIHNGNEAMLLDPGGHKVHYDLMNLRGVCLYRSAIVTYTLRYLNRGRDCRSDL